MTGPDGRGMRSERGAALAYVIGMIALLAVCTGMALRQVRQDLRLTLREASRSQSARLAEAATSCALARLGGSDPRPSGLAISDLRGILEEGRLTFRADVEPWGAGARIRGTGRADFPGWPSERELRSEAGQRLDWNGWPALILMDRGATLVMAGRAHVAGPIQNWLGRTAAETDYRIRFTGTMPPASALRDSTAPYWRHLPFDFSYLRGWFDRADAAAGGRWPAQWEAGPNQGADSLVLRDTVVQGGWIRAGRAIRLEKGAVLSQVRLLAPHIGIHDGARLSACLATAGRSLELQGGASIDGGQFLAGDSMEIDFTGKTGAMPVFAVRGRAYPKGNDTLYAGVMRVARFDGEGIFLAAALDKPRWVQTTDLVVGSEAKLRGIAYAAGFAEVAGSVEGSLIAGNLQLTSGGTIFLGRLRDGRISSPGSSGAALAIPFLAPHWPLVAMRKELR